MYIVVLHSSILTNVFNRFLLNSFTYYTINAYVYSNCLIYIFVYINHWCANLLHVTLLYYSYNASIKVILALLR